MNNQILIKPIISEKSLNQTARSFYTFAVATFATKPEIKKAVEEAFGVKVLDVHTMRVKGKKIKAGRKRQIVSKNTWKKAVVRLPSEQKIDLFENFGGESAPATPSAKATGVKKAIADKSEDKKK